MQPLGYLYKRVERRPDWLEAPHVTDVFALSGCVSPNFADYIEYLEAQRLLALRYSTGNRGACR